MWCEDAMEASACGYVDGNGAFSCGGRHERVRQQGSALSWSPGAGAFSDANRKEGDAVHAVTQRADRHERTAHTGRPTASHSLPRSAGWARDRRAATGSACHIIDTWSQLHSASPNVWSRTKK